MCNFKGVFMINVIASISVKSSHLASFIEIFKANIPSVLAEEGCIEYTANIDLITEIPVQLLDANTVTIVEKWQSIDHLYAHLNAPHMLEYKAKVTDMVDDLSIKILQAV